MFELLNANRILIRLTFSPPRIPNFNRYEVEGSIGSVQNRLLSNAAPSRFILRELMSPYFIAERARSVYPLSLKHVQTQHGVLIPSKRSKWPWAQNFIFSFSPTNTYLVGNMWAFSSLKKKQKHNKPIGKWGSVKVTCDGFLVTIKPKIDWGNLNCATCWMKVKVKVKQVKIILWK